MNLSVPFLHVTDVDSAARPLCPCTQVRGWSNQGSADALITLRSTGHRSYLSDPLIVISRDGLVFRLSGCQFEHNF